MATLTNELEARCIGKGAFQANDLQFHSAFVCSRNIYHDAHEEITLDNSTGAKIVSTPVQLECHEYVTQATICLNMEFTELRIG